VAGQVGSTGAWAHVRYGRPRQKYEARGVGRRLRLDEHPAQLLTCTAAAPEVSRASARQYAKAEVAEGTQLMCVKVPA